MNIYSLEKTKKFYPLGYQLAKCHFDYLSFRPTLHIFDYLSIKLVDIKHGNITLY